MSTPFFTKGVGFDDLLQCPETRPLSTAGGRFRRSFPAPNRPSSSCRSLPPRLRQPPANAKTRRQGFDNHKSLGRERGGGLGEGRGKPFFRKVPSPFPRFSCYLHQGALPLSQRALRACASRRVSMHCQKPVWRNMESWPSAARRSSGSFSRSQDSSSER